MKGTKMKKVLVKEKLELELKYQDFDIEIIPHINALNSFALKMTNDMDDAGDLVQDTLLKAFRFFDKFEKGLMLKHGCSRF